MTSRPPDIRIDDLGDPVFPDEIRALLDAAAPMAESVHLEPEALMDQARERTGLEDFGNDIFREPLGVLCRALTEEADLSPTGKIGAAGQLTQFLSNRLLVEDTIRRHPEIEDIEIARPIVIAGMPRSGTTHLHNLVSADPALRSLPWWEALEPVPPPGEEGTDGRIERAKAGLDQLHALLPHYDRMHEMTWDHVHEEIHLLAVAGSTMLFDCMGVMPSFTDWYLSTDQTPYYQYTKRILAVLQHLRGGERWVLKSPQHLEQFGPLVATYPDATFVVTHRDPVSVTASFTTMICYSARTSHPAPLDLERMGRYWADRFERLFEACARDRELLPADQSVDVLFHEFMADDVATVRHIYELAGQPFTPDVEAAMHAYMADHPRGRHGKVVYDLADFGLDRAERRRALQFYVDRFGVAVED